jgi:endonuclease/exonuclease/phosphatase (EEP) superfamily protein YafD
LPLRIDILTTTKQKPLAALPFWRRAAKIVLKALSWLFNSFALAVTLLIGGLLTVSSFSDLISPTVWIVMSYLGLIFPILLILAILWWVMLLATHRWRMSLILLAALMICSPRIWRYSPLHLSPQEAVTGITDADGMKKTVEADTFRLMTFNTRGLGDAHVRNLKEDLPVMNLVRVCGADVVLLQEYSFSLTTGHTEQQLRNSMKDLYPYHHVLLYSNRKDMGLAVYSKWPILKNEKIDSLKTNYTSAAYYELNVRGRRIGIVNCHLAHNAISKSNRKLYNEQVSHFEKDSLKRMEDGLREIGPSFRARAAQSATINRYLNKREDTRQPLLICGDMNDTPTSFTYRSMRGELGDAWVDAGFGPGISYKEAPFWFRIDHVFHSDHFRTLDAQVVKTETKSDHYPIMVTFQLLPEGQ